MKNIELFNLALWNKPEKLHFECASDGKSKISDYSKTTVLADSLDNLLLDKPHHPTYVKIDVGGAEFEILQGMDEIIKRDHPKLAINISYKLRDIWEIPLYLMETYPGYRCYIRQHWYHTETVLYAIWEKDKKEKKK
jgi:hypothetical protein